MSVLLNLRRRMLMTKRDVFVVASKSDMRLTSELNAKENLEKEFREKCRLLPVLADCRNRSTIKTIFIDALDPVLRKMYPSLPAMKKDPKELQNEAAQKKTEEPVLLPKKDDGCRLI